MIRKLLLGLFAAATIVCSAPAASDAQLPPPPPPGGGGGGEVIPPPPPPVIPPPPPVIPPPPVVPPTFTIGPSFTPVVAPTPAAAATQITLPEFHSSTILPTDTLPFKVNGPVQVHLSQGAHRLTNFNVLFDDKSMMLVVAEGTDYASETPITNPTVITSVTPVENTPEAIQKREAEQQLVQQGLLMSNYDNELAAPQTVAPLPSDNTTAEDADRSASDTVDGKVESDGQAPAKRTVMQKIKSFFKAIGGNAKKPTVQPTRKSKASPAEYKASGKFTPPAPKTTLELSKGCMLIRGHEPVKVTAAGKDIYVQNDATALIMTDGKQLKIVTLNNRRGKSVYVVLDDKRHSVEIPLQSLWKFEGNKLARLRGIITVQPDADPNAKRPKIEQWEADRMILNDILVNHPLVYSMCRSKSPYANHKCTKQYIKTIAAYAHVNAQRRKNLGLPLEAPPAPGTYTIWNHFFVR